MASDNSITKVKDLFEREFSTRDELLDSIETGMLGGAAAALEVFLNDVQNLDPDKAAGAAAALMSKYTELKRARNSDFKNDPINITLLQKLEVTIGQLSERGIDPSKVKVIDLPDEPEPEEHEISTIEDAKD